MQILLSRTQPEPGWTGKQEQEEISPNHVQRLNLISVLVLLDFMNVREEVSSQIYKQRTNPHDNAAVVRSLASHHAHALRRAKVWAVMNDGRINVSVVWVWRAAERR